MPRPPAGFRIDPRRHPSTGRVWPRCSPESGFSRNVTRRLPTPSSGSFVSSKKGPPTKARWLNDLAMIRAAAGDLRVARTLLERSVQLLRQGGDTSSGAYGEVLGNLALVCVRQGDGAAAEPLYRQAIATVEAALGPDHPHLGMLLAEHGKLLKKMGRKTDARSEERRARAILETSALPGRHTIDVRGRH